MASFLNLLALGSVLISLSSCAGGKTPIDQIIGSIAFLAFAIFAVGAAIIEKLNKMQKNFTWERDLEIAKAAQPRSWTKKLFG